MVGALCKGGAADDRKTDAWAEVLREERAGVSLRQEARRVKAERGERARACAKAIQCLDVGWSNRREAALQPLLERG